MINGSKLEMFVCLFVFGISRCVANSSRLTVFVCLFVPGGGEWSVEAD